MIIAAKIISVLFNPLVISPLTFFFLILYNNNVNKSILFFICVFFTTIMPGIIIAFFKLSGRISAYEAPIRSERLPLLVFASISNAIGFIILNYLNAPPIVKGLMFCYAVNTGVTWGITKYWKISIHMIGLGGPLVAIYISGFYDIALFTIIVILVYISRLVLKAHTHNQLIAGITLAIFLAYLELTYLFL